MKIISLACLFLSFLTPAFASSSHEEQSPPEIKIQYASDFSSLAKTAHNEGKIILLEVSANDCDYCELLEEYYLKPMLADNKYMQNIIIRKIDNDSYQSLIDFTGNKTSSDEFASKLKVRFTPTMIFFDSDGNEVAERIIGINTLELFGGYIDAAIETGMKSITTKGIAEK